MKILKKMIKDSVIVLKILPINLHVSMEYSGLLKMSLVQK
jgi:hypothetical protein